MVWCSSWSVQGYTVYTNDPCQNNKIQLRVAWVILDLKIGQTILTLIKFHI